MNRFVQEHGETYRQTQIMREQLLDILTDADLIFTPGGVNPSLGELCREVGEIEYSYIESLKTLKQDWSYRHAQPGLTGSVHQLRDWYGQLDAVLKSTMENLTDDDLNKIIERGFPVPVAVQLHIYREALLIFYAKVAVYLKAMGKTLPQQWQDWIG